MVSIDVVKSAIQGFLPESMADYWWGVIAWAVIIFILVIVLIIRILNKKSGSAKVAQFKQQNLSAIQPAAQVIPQEHKAVMEQHNVHVPHERYEQLDSYISAMLKRQMTPPMIRTYLLNVGWNAQIVDEAFARLQKR